MAPQDGLPHTSNLAPTFAGFTGFDGGAGLGAIAVAVSAGVVEHEADVFFGAEDGLQEFNSDGDFQVAAAGRSTRLLAAEAGAVHDFVEDVREIKALEALGTMRAAAPAKRTALRAGVAKLVVARALLRILEYLIGLADFLELGIIAPVLVWMVLHGKLTVGTLNLIRRGGLGDA
jgi:hypothetical protein